MSASTETPRRDRAAGRFLHPARPATAALSPRGFLAGLPHGEAAVRPVQRGIAHGEGRGLPRGPEVHEGAEDARAVGGIGGEEPVA